MDETVKKFIDDIFEFESNVTYHFRELYDLTFVFREELTHIKKHLASGEIKPSGIIYEKNDEYYFAPLDTTVNIEAVIQEYVNYMLK